MNDEIIRMLEIWNFMYQHYENNSLLFQGF